MTAEVMAARVAGLLEDAFEITGDEVKVVLLTERKIRLVDGNDRFDLTVVKKR